MNRPICLLRLCLLLAAASTALPAAAEVYRWVDAQGNTHYGDKPPSRDARPAQLPPLQIIAGSSPAPAARSAADADDVAPPTAVKLAIASPTPEQVLRNADRRLSVAVTLSTPLPEGAGLVYRLDGSARNPKPVADLSFTMNDVDRGSHLVEVSAVDARGKELGRAGPVLVHLMPPKL